MAEELEEVLRKFALSEKEVSGVQINGEDVSKGLAECKVSIIDKVRGEKIVNISGI